MTFENTVANEEIAHDEQFLHLPQCFQFITIMILLLIILLTEIFSIVANMISKSLAADLLYVGKCGKGYNMVSQVLNIENLAVVRRY